MVRVSYADSDLFQINNITNEVGTITVNKQNIKNGATLQYSTDGANFTTAAFSNNVCEIELPAGGNCYFKGTDFYRSYDYITSVFNCSVNHNVRGNLYSLIDPVNYVSSTASYNNMFASWFYGNTHLVDASGLMMPVGVTSIGDYGLQNTFYGCTSLTTAPDLSSVTSIGNSGLYYVFYNCSKLQTIYVPNVDSWNTNTFVNWVQNAGSSAATPKQMIFQTQALLDACPSGNSGYGNYSKVLA